MPIKSYLAYPARGRRDELADLLRAMPGCQVIPSLNRELLLVVTDTPDEAADQSLQEALAHVPLLEGLALVAGVSEADQHGTLQQEVGHDET